MNPRISDEDFIAVWCEHDCLKTITALLGYSQVSCTKNRAVRLRKRGVDVPRKQNRYSDAADVLRQRRVLGNGCWEFQGTVNNLNGYGQAVFRRQRWLVHRLAYIHFVGPIPDGLYVLHHCDNKWCINPDHLFLGTTQDNTADMISKGREARGSRQGLAKLNESDVPIIREMIRSGLTHKEIAASFSVDKKSIWNIAHGKTWTHVPDKLAELQGVER